MKKYIGIFFVVINITFSSYAGVGGSAGGASMTWKEIGKDRTLEADFPSITFAGLRFISIDQVCLDGYDLRTKKKVTIYGTKPLVKDYIRTPIFYEKEICSRAFNDECQWEIQQIEHKLEIEVDVYSSRTFLSDFRSINPIFRKKYVIPECQEIIKTIAL